jgi:hypothetical protein
MPTAEQIAKLYTAITGREADLEGIREHLAKPISVVHFVPNDGTGNQPTKLADAELHFLNGPLHGLKLVGFAVWERKGGGRNVTFPARQYSVNGERRSFALLRPISDSFAQDRLRDMILDAYVNYEAEPEGGAR